MCFTNMVIRVGRLFIKIVPSLSYVFKGENALIFQQQEKYQPFKKYVNVLFVPPLVLFMNKKGWKRLKRYTK